MINKIYYWLFIVWLSTKWIFRTTLCDDVIYKGKKYSINNGVVCNCWTLIDDNRHTFEAQIKDCKKVWSLKGMIRSFKSGYFFYMTSWYSIWCREDILPWMKSCQIW